MIVSPGELELVALPADAIGSHVLIVSGINKVDLRELTGGELQTVYFLHIDQAAFES
ncbi:hypothetical protein D3C72_2506450 [compost metagenome]